MEYYVSARTLTGRVRRNNEDTFCLDGETLPLIHGDSEQISRKITDEIPHLISVFDGMGGYSGGEKASFLAASTAQCYWDKIGSKDTEELLVQLCLEANDRVCDAAEGSQMGTTCAMLCLEEDCYTVCNVGDSPVFLVRAGKMEQLSVDHNQRAMYEQITGKPADPHQKFKLTQCIGIPQDEMLIEPFTAEGIPRGGDVFLLCSDGITDMLSKNDICEIIVASETAEEAVTRLTEQAMENGGKDNITAVCVKVADTKEEGFVKEIFRRIVMFFGYQKRDRKEP